MPTAASAGQIPCCDEVDCRAPTQASRQVVVVVEDRCAKPERDDHTSGSRAAPSGRHVLCSCRARWRECACLMERTSS
eukprot:3520757-Pyramimonas_sp.AAC.1